MSHKYKGWKYYNHSIISTCAPHEIPNTDCIDDEIFNELGGLFLRYTTDFDTAQPTDYWYVIKEAPFSLDDIDHKYRKKIGASLRKCAVKKVNPADCLDDLVRVYKEAVVRYKSADNIQSDEQIRDYFLSLPSTMDVWCAYSNELGFMIGYMVCTRSNTYVEANVSKYSAKYLNYRASDALHYAVLSYYLNDAHFGYVCSGTKNINHKTNVQEYLIRHWKYRKAYCKLHIIYSKKIKWLINLLFPFRRLFLLLDNIGKVHQLNAVLKMEEIARS